MYNKEASGIFWTHWLIHGANNMHPSNEQHNLHVKGIVYSVKRYIDAWSDEYPTVEEIFLGRLFGEILECDMPGCLDFKMEDADWCAKHLDGGAFTLEPVPSSW